MGKWQTRAERKSLTLEIALNVLIKYVVCPFPEILGLPGTCLLPSCKDKCWQGLAYENLRGVPEMWPRDVLIQRDWVARKMSVMIRMPGAGASPVRHFHPRGILPTLAGPGHRVSQALSAPDGDAVVLPPRGSPFPVSSSGGQEAGRRQSSPYESRV